jgi:hypothetical protein
MVVRKQWLGGNLRAVNTIRMLLTDKEKKRRYPLKVYLQRMASKQNCILTDLGTVTDQELAYMCHGTCAEASDVLIATKVNLFVFFLVFFCYLVLGNYCYDVGFCPAPG